jgi:DNA replication protein DnaC
VEKNGVRSVERCVCWQETASAQLLAGARVPPRYAKCTLENFLVYPNEKLNNAITGARRFADAFPAVKKGLFLIGPTGIGKTHIAVAVLRHVILTCSARALYYDFSELLKVIRSTYNPIVRTAEIGVLKPVMEAELLVLDDLGREKTSEWVEETMNLIVNTRYNENRPTIFTSNYADVDEDTNLDSLKVRIGFRNHSRIHEMCEFLEWDGGDYRLLPPNGGPEELATLWKRRKGRPDLPARTHGPARAQIKAPRELKELPWPGGKAGRS